MSPRVAPPLKAGHAAPPLELPDAAGARVRLQDFRGRPVLVSFLSHAA